MTSGKKPVRVGVIGLGIMGGSYARLMRDAGMSVCGYDASEDAVSRLADCGGIPCTSPVDVAARSNVILLALPSVEALDDVVTGPSGITKRLHRDTIVCEMGTFSIEDKARVAEAVSNAGGTVLDCPVSGTGAQAAVGDLVVYASGDEQAANSLRPVFDAIAREVRYVGEFGAGMKMKIVANLLVTVHNLAAAEALLLAQRSGLDLHLVFDAITSGAGTSRMLEVRGQMMIDENYEPPTMRHDVYAKDLEVIMDQAQAVHAPVPLMTAALPLYDAARAEGRGDEDTASLFSVLKGMT